MSNTTYGYIRVSSKDQNEERQRIAMREAGVEDKYIFMDKQSGRDFERPGILSLKLKYPIYLPMTSPSIYIVSQELHISQNTSNY